MKEQLDRIINEINSSNFSLNEKIRYAYISLGKIVYKDAMFFYTIQRNLIGQGKESVAYSIDEIDNIVNSDEYFNYATICKTVADMLKYIYDNCDINSEIRKTINYDIYEDNNGKVEIRHFFLAVTGDNDNVYALTLNPDLPNIQIGKKTSHFGNDIIYEEEKTIVNDDGEEETIVEQKYEGDKINFTILSEEELESLDRRIGYLNTQISVSDTPEVNYTDYFFDLIEKAYIKDNEYIDDLITETKFYHDLCHLLNGTKNLDQVFANNDYDNEEQLCIDFKFSDKTESNWNEIKIFMSLMVILNSYDVVNEILDGNNKFAIDINGNLLDKYRDLIIEKRYDDILKSFLLDLQTRGIYNNQLKKLRKRNPLLKINQTIFLMKYIDQSFANNFSVDEGFDIKLFKEKLKDVCMTFIDDKYLAKRDCIPSSYLSHKIISSFNKIFDIGMPTDFNNMHLAEQVTIIKELLNTVFYDLKPTKETQKIQNSKTEIQKRMITTVLFDKENHNPYYLMCTKVMSPDDKYIPIIYDLTNNVLIKDQSLMYIKNNYFIIKYDEIKLITEEIEKNTNSRTY